jgi:DNA-binding CsgD family transcriptional regulator
MIFFFDSGNKSAASLREYCATANLISLARTENPVAQWRRKQGSYPTPAILDQVGAPKRARMDSAAGTNAPARVDSKKTVIPRHFCSHIERGVRFLCQETGGGGVCMAAANRDDHNDSRSQTIDPQDFARRHAGLSPEQWQAIVGGGGGSRGTVAGLNLSGRQIQLLEMILQEMTEKEMAAALGRSINTVRELLHRMFHEKCHCRTKAGAVTAVLRMVTTLSPPSR